jgi:predicted SAM-dependent methyltransferase
VESAIFLRKILYFDFKFKCSVCGSFVKCFLPAGHPISVNEELEIIGGQYRPEDTCPVCLSHSRTRLVVRYIFEKLEINTLCLCVLHIAPELGIYLAMHKMGNIDYTPADFSIERYANSFRIEQMDITKIHYDLNSFYVIICNYVLEHIENDGLAMAELLRVLKPGGWAILQVPISKKLTQTYENPNIVDPAERERHFGQNDHVRVYAMDYVERLSNVGFSVEVFDPMVC